MSANSQPELLAFKSILYLTDFSESSDAPLAFGMAVSRIDQGILRVLHVVTPSVPGFLSLEDFANEGRAKEQMRKIESRLVGLRCETRLERDVRVWPTVQRLLPQSKIDLILMGTHGKTNMQRFALGSVADEVFRHSTVSILTVNPSVHRSSDNDVRFDRVLYATDFSPESMVAAPFAISLAQRNRSHLIVLHVMRVPKKGSEREERQFEASVADTIGRLRGIVSVGVDLHSPPEVILEHGEVADRITEAARRTRADLIVLGDRPVGSQARPGQNPEDATTQKIILNATCPVLTVRSICSICGKPWPDSICDSCGDTIRKESFKQENSSSSPA